ncbi:uncharacterized protein LOC127156126 [Labeo rohita]|uniref:uncharacterized protein LOC127156126 n=1 Tax=Labeo rohita TaxID=84645 RepID=UPI0021E23E84|nr:uncharacterized protein LOC127156126 [Labeo rohita]
MTSLRPELKNIIKQSSETGGGTLTRYHVKLKTDPSSKHEPYKKLTFGERDKNKPHKTILMVGETRTGKTTLINVMINYILDVQREDKIWFEITDDQSDQSVAYSQTSSITVYGFYLQESLIDLTIIDTPGYGNIRGIKNDQEIAKSLLSLSQSASGIQIDAVCLVMKETENLSDRQMYIFDAVQSLFGKDIAENIVLLFTHSDGMRPKNALTAVKEAEIKCAVNDKNQPVYFLFNNRQSDAADEDFQKIQKQSWILSYTGMTEFFKVLETLQPKTLKMTRDVLQQREQLEANINILQSHVQVMEQKQNTLKQTQKALEQNRNYVRAQNDIKYEVKVTYKEKIPIDLKYRNRTKEATCCTVCEENCHYPGCWWVTDLSWCSVMKDNHCTVCTKKCHYSRHVKEAKIYVTKTKIEKRTHEKIKREYDGKIVDSESLVRNLEEELQELDKEKIKLVFEAFHCMQTLQMIALNTDSLLTLLHVDFLIQKLKEINGSEKAKTLENIKKKTGEEKQGALGYIIGLLSKNV